MGWATATGLFSLLPLAPVADAFLRRQPSRSQLPAAAGVASSLVDSGTPEALQTSSRALMKLTICGPTSQGTPRYPGRGPVLEKAFKKCQKKKSQQIFHEILMGKTYGFPHRLFLWKMDCKCIVEKMNPKSKQIDVQMLSI